MAGDAADVLKDRLRTDLKAAMAGRDRPKVAVLRALVAAVDNAQAAPIEGRHDRYVVHAFGDRSAEVPRLSLSEADVRALLAREAGDRRAAAAEFARLGQADRAAVLEAEAEVIEGY